MRRAGQCGVKFACGCDVFVRWRHCRGHRSPQPVGLAHLVHRGLQGLAHVGGGRAGQLTCTFGGFEEAGGHGIQMDALVHDVADHVRAGDCPVQFGLSSGNPMAQSGLQPFVQRRRVWPGSEACGGQHGRAATDVAEGVECHGRVARNGKWTIDVAQRSDCHRVRGGHVDDAQNVREDGGRCGIVGFNPGINMASQLTAIVYNQIRCHAEKATETCQRFSARGVGWSNVPARPKTCMDLQGGSRHLVSQCASTRGSRRVSGIGLASGRYGQQQGSGGFTERRVRQGPAGQWRRGGDLDFLDSVIEGLVVHDHVEELADVGLPREGRHPPATNQLRVDRAS